MQHPVRITLCLLALALFSGLSATEKPSVIKGTVVTCADGLLTLAVNGPDGAASDEEMAIVITAKSKIKMRKDDHSAEDLVAGTQVEVRAAANKDGQMEARIIRIIPEGKPGKKKQKQAGGDPEEESSEENLDDQNNGEE